MHMQWGWHAVGGGADMHAADTHAVGGADMHMK